MPDDTTDATTRDVMARFAYTNDIVGTLLLASLPILIGLHGAGLIDLSTVPQSLMVAYGIIVGTDAVWMFGIDAVKTWTDLRG